MKIIHFQLEGREEYGFLRGDEIAVAKGDIFASLSETGTVCKLSEVEVLPPVAPSKIVAVGLNYRDHAEEFGEAIPDVPKIFLKPSTAVLAYGREIVMPPMAKQVDYEAELAAVIKKTCKNVSPEASLDYVLGYTCLNDVTARDLQSHDGQWTRAKGFDTFAPVGPVIETDVNPDALEVTLLHNGEVRQRSNTCNFIFKMNELISFISQIMTLLPGDIVTTGTPSGVGPLASGDRVSVVIEGIGALENGVCKG